jgi:hypothetical protein
MYASISLSIQPDAWSDMSCAIVSAPKFEVPRVAEAGWRRPVTEHPLAPMPESVT